MQAGVAFELLQVFGAAGRREVFLGDIDFFAFGGLAEAVVEPGAHFVGHGLGLHRFLGEILEGLDQGSQIQQIPFGSAHGGSYGKAYHLVHFSYAFGGFGPALDQGEEGYAGFFLSLETAFYGDEEVILVTGFELLKLLQGAELEGGGCPDIDDFLPEGGRKDLVLAQHHHGHLVREVQ